MRIGITGHQARDGIKWNWVRAKTLQFLSGKVGLIGYSSLAEGSDQVFAECVLEMRGSIFAVIPIDNYESFFHGEALRRYTDLLGKSDIIELNSEKEQKQAFLEAGKWIVRSVDAMVAVWDGEPAEGKGGTAEIVSYAKSLGVSVHHIDPVRQVIKDY